MALRKVLAAALACAAFAPAAQSQPAAGSAPCATSGLVIWLNTQGDNAAGSSYYNLEFTNLSGQACTLRGYPGVSAVDLHGRQLGSPALRETSSASLTRLAPGASGSSVLRITVAGNFPVSRCRSVLAAGLRVYPPGQTAAKVIPFPFSACSKTGPAYLSIKTVT